MQSNAKGETSTKEIERKKETESFKHENTVAFGIVHKIYIRQINKKTERINARWDRNVVDRAYKKS
jgi:hypothetical protein